MRSLTLLVFLFVFPGAVPASIYRVPEDYPTVLSALDAAVAGDSVLVGPGTWTAADTREVQYRSALRTLRFNGLIQPGVTLIGTSGAEATILEGVPVEPAIQHGLLVLPGDAPGPAVRIQGLTLRGAGYLFRGLLTSSRVDVIIEDCVFEQSQMAIRTIRADLEIRRTVFRDHDATQGPLFVPGIDSALDSRWLLEDCEFLRNVGSRLLWNQGETVGTTLRRCVFRENEGRVVELSRQDPLVIEDCWFEGNLVPANIPGQIMTLNYCDGTVRGNSVLFSGVTSSPGASLLHGINSTLTIEENTFFGNDGGFGAVVAGVALDTRVPVTFRNNVLAGFRGGAALGIVSGGFTQPAGGCNIFWDNDEPQFFRYTPKPTDLEADPLFCDAEAGDLTVAENSPCLPDGIPGCDLVGAWGQGCGIISIEPTSWARIKSLYREEDER